MRGDALTVFNAFRDHGWIGNSLNRADADVVRFIASMAGFEPHFTHQSDSLEVTEELILNGMGIGLLPADRLMRPGVALLPLTQPEVRQRAYAQTRRGHASWPPLRLLLDRLIG
jgi:DNA-binding transcriptional LysR family regulator